MKKQSSTKSVEIWEQIGVDFGLVLRTEGAWFSELEGLRLVSFKSWVLHTESFLKFERLVVGKSIDISVWGLVGLEDFADCVFAELLLFGVRDGLDRCFDSDLVIVMLGGLFFWVVAEAVVVIGPE